MKQECSRDCDSTGSLRHPSHQQPPESGNDWRTRLQHEFFLGLSEEQLPSNHIGREELEDFISAVEAAAIARERNRVRREVEKRKVPGDSPTSVEMLKHGLIPYGELINQALDDLLASLDQDSPPASEG